MIDFPLHVKIKNDFCYCYYGTHFAFIWQLLYLRKFIEKQFPNLKLFICSLKEDINEERVIHRDQFKNIIFAKTKEIVFNQDNPILKIAIESDIEISETLVEQKNNKCVVLTDAKQPFVSMNKETIEKIKKLCDQEKYEFILNDKIDDAGLVIGVECEEFYRAAYLGKKTLFVDSGFGKEHYKKLFPGRGILE